MVHTTFGPQTFERFFSMLRDVESERGLPLARLVTRGYWRAGEQNHPDHDYGED